MVEKIQKTAPSSGFAIASMVCAIVGGVFTLTLIGAVLGVPLLIIAFVLGMIVLMDKKPGQGMAIVGVAIPVIAGIGMLIGGYFVGRVVQDIKTPIEAFSQEIDQMIEEDPELADLMKDESFEDQVEELTEKKIKELLTETINSDDGFDMSMIAEVIELGLDSYKESLYELKETHLAEKESE